ncbi:MAG TPA: hemolysin family protein [Deltaproteobacteria bacterium]|nr:hemolysin family protein [Deltaproteobacteria bacterium]HQB38693.1 hemolysin family protein [Deltaproteobacteria bacterium]
MEDGSTIKTGLIELFNRFLTGRRKITSDELHDLIRVGEDEGIVNEEESEMIRSIFSLRSTVVREIMVPRTDMACVSVEASIKEILETIISCGHSRIPVYENNIDNIIGLLYAKDLLRYWFEQPDQLQVRSIVRTPYFIPETKNLEQLLQEFKLKHVHLAIVIDEYGGTSGLVTIEDLLEQIVGDIQDEYDREEARYIVNPDGSITADARMPVEELEEHYSIQIERDKFDTVGGLIFHLTGKIPSVGDVIESESLRFTVLEADKRHIIKVGINTLADNGQVA